MEDSTNETIVINAKLYGLKRLDSISSQVRHLVKSLLDDQCFTIHIYSNIRKRCVQQTLENYIQFLGTALRIDRNEIPSLTKGTNQPTNFFLITFFHDKTDEKGMEDGIEISKKLK